MRAIFEVWPALEERVPWVELGHFPTPIESLDAALDDIAGGQGRAWVKRDDRTSPIYGGNKVRTLEVLFGDAISKGATHIYSTGAFGSNHATATVLHAPAAGLKPGAVLFPQPRSDTAVANLKAILQAKPQLLALPHWSTLPIGMWAARRRHGAGGRSAVMVPGGATPLGGLGYVSAGLELAMQVRDGAAPAPKEIIVGVGSTCTTAGLLVGLHHAARQNIGWTTAPSVRAVRVTPWPVTSRRRIAWLARTVSLLLADLLGDPQAQIAYKTLLGSLQVDGRFLGKGYGFPTKGGHEAIARFERLDGLKLDTTYSAKAAAAVVDAVKGQERGPLLYWATKSTAPLPEGDPDALAQAPWLMRRWLGSV